MKVTIIGTGYVGLVSGACLSEMGNHVVCLDVDDRKIAMLNEGRIPIHEPGLPELVQRNSAAGRLQFTSDPAMATAHGAIQCIAVGTPPGEDGSADVSYVLEAARTIGRLMTEDKIVVTKSTVPVGTTDRVRDAVQAELRQRGEPLKVSAVSNPEFLKEGAAVEDFMRPDRVIVGVEDERALALMRALYSPFLRNRDRMLVMDVRSAEFSKYAANTMLATRISFMNEMARLAERLGADIELVRRGVGADPRIGSRFLYPGCGYGGSCLPKDVKALARTAAEYEVSMPLLDAVERVNERAKQVLVEKVVQRLGADLTGRTFALWGLAFKPETDDMREAPSLVIVRELLRRGARVRAYDPVAVPAAQALLADSAGVDFPDNATEALKGADALIIATEWKEFRTPDLEALKGALKFPLVFDGRNLYDPQLMREERIEYYGIGRGGVVAKGT
jgi:UDPglucose 6-dehydrogenase